MSEATGSSELPGIVKALPSTTGSVLLVDRKTGKVFNNGLSFIKNA